MCDTIEVSNFFFSWGKIMRLTIDQGIQNSSSTVVVVNERENLMNNSISIFWMVNSTFYKGLYGM